MATKDGNNGPGKGSGQRGKKRGTYNGNRPQNPAKSKANISMFDDYKKASDKGIPPADVNVKQLTEDALAKILSRNAGEMPQPPAKASSSQSPVAPPVPPPMAKPRMNESAPSKADRLAGTIIDLLENNETPPEKYLSIVSSTHTGLDLFFAAIARTTARSAQHLFEFCNHCEGELFDIDSEAWQKLEPWEKFRYYQTANEAYQSKMKFITQVAQKINWENLETEVKQLVATVQSGQVIDPQKQQLAKNLLEAIISGNMSDLQALGISVHPDSIDRNLATPTELVDRLPAPPESDDDEI